MIFHTDDKCNHTNGWRFEIMVAASRPSRTEVELKGGVLHLLRFMSLPQKDKEFFLPLLSDNYKVGITILEYLMDGEPHTMSEVASYMNISWRNLVDRYLRPMRDGGLPFTQFGSISVSVIQVDRDACLLLQLLGDEVPHSSSELCEKTGLDKETCTAKLYKMHLGSKVDLNQIKGKWVLTLKKLN